MYSVMIVDDERPARELLKMMTDWQSAGFELVCEAFDGEDALEKFDERKIDLVITDMQMPRMDGIELIKQIRSRAPEQQIAIISCHESFAYAQKALRYGVMDYLIKDATTSQDMQELLMKSAERIAKTNKQTGVHKQPLSTQGLFSSLLSNTLTEKDIESYIVEHNLSGKAHDYFVMLILLEGKAKPSPSIRSKVEERLNHTLNAAEGGLCSYLENGLFVAVSFISCGRSQLEMFYKRYETTQTIRRALTKEADCEISIGISRTFESLCGLEAHYIQAQHALNYRVFLGKGRNLYYDTLQDPQRHVQAEVLDLRINHIKSALEEMDKEAILLELTNLYSQDLKGIMQLNYLTHTNSILYLILTEECIKKGISLSDVLEGGDLSSLEAYTTVEEMCTWFIARFTLLLDKCSVNSYEYSTRIRKVIAYIQQHYDTELSLNVIADKFGIHKVHLARTFKEETGTSINAYILDLRIAKAKHLLQSTNCNVNEILHKVGFNNAQNFYALFKKSTGLSPNEFREE